MITYDSLFIGGAWVRPDSNARIDVLSASTGEPIGSVPGGTTADIDAAVAAARRAFASLNERHSHHGTRSRHPVCGA